MTELDETRIVCYMVDAGRSLRQAVDLCRQCIGIFQRSRDAWGTALSELVLADTANLGGLDADLARTSYQASLDGFVRLGND